MSERTPTLTAAIDRAIKRGQAELRVALPARIEGFDPATQLARVKPLLWESDEIEEGGETASPLPVISDVPVQFPGAGGFVITFPVEAGTPCWLVFSDRSLDKWIAAGDDQDPVDVRRHHLSDPVALLGIRSRAAALAEFDEARAFFGSTDPSSSGVGVAIQTGTVHLGVTPGESAAFHLALAEKVEAEINALRAVVATLPAVAHTHTAPGGATGPALGAVASPPAVGDTSSPTVLARG